jgi:hypothetical protein
MTVAPQKSANASIVDARLSAKLAPYSYQMIRLSAP